MGFNLRTIRNITSKELTTVGVKTSDYTANSFERVVVNSAAAALTVTLPQYPLQGDRIEIVDIGGVADVNPYTISRNGKLINGAPTDSELNVPYGSTNLLYTEELGWVDYGKWISDLIPRIELIELLIGGLDTDSPSDLIYAKENFGGF